VTAIRGLVCQTLLSTRLGTASNEEIRRTPIFARNGRSTRPPHRSGRVESLFLKIEKFTSSKRGFLSPKRLSTGGARYSLLLSEICCPEGQKREGVIARREVLSATCPIPVVRTGKFCHESCKVKHDIGNARQESRAAFTLMPATPPLRLDVDNTGCPSLPTFRQADFLEAWKLPPGRR